MKIVDIFAEEYPEHLYAFTYEKYDVNEYDRLMDLWTDVHYLVSGRKHNKIKIDSFEPISLFFLSADAKASPKERKAKYLSKFIQFVKTVCFRPDTI